MTGTGEVSKARRAALVLAAAASMALMSATPASAGMKKGDYACSYYTSFGSNYAGTMNILSKKKYSVNDNKPGKYTFKKGILNFKTGDYKGLYFGQRVSKSDVEMYGFKDGEYYMTCSR